MKTQHWIAAAAVAVAIVGLTPRVISQDAPEAGPGGLTQARLDELAARSQPGPQHELLARLSGEWMTRSRIITGPTLGLGLGSAEALLAEGTTTNEMILGGRFLACTASTRGGPVVLEQLNLFGFDRRVDAFTLASFDTWGTQYLTATGQRDETTGVLTLTGQTTDPRPGAVAAFEVELSIEGPDEYTLRYYLNPTGEARALKLESIHTRAE